MLLGRQKLEDLNRLLNWTAITIAVAAAASLILEFGTYLPREYPWMRIVFNSVDAVLVASMIGLTLVRLYLASNKWRNVVQHRGEWFLIVLLLLQFIMLNAFGEHGRFSQFFSRVDTLTLLKLYIFFFIGLKAFHWNRQWFFFNLSPAALMVLTFTFVIVIGWVLLSLPRCTTRDDISLLDTLFTSCSAVCVTGLVTLDTGQDFSPFGQLVIMGLIQLGGLGLMTWAVSVMGLTQKTLGLRERATMVDVLNTRKMGSIHQMTRRIVIFTFLSEALGAVLIHALWPEDGGAASWMSSIFHSVSAFCNAGFSLFSSNLESWRGEPALLAIGGLFVLGGIGFPVLLEIFSRTSWRRPQINFLRRFTVHTKLVLLVTFLLITFGYIGVGYLEWQFGTTPMTVIDVFFQAITPRTAGFNSVPTSQLAQPTLLFIILLMYIGASPAGTGGGIKTSTFAIQVGQIFTVFRGRERLEMMARTLPRHMVQAAMMIGVLSSMLIATSVFLLRCVEPPDHTLLDLMFEEVSAFGTVGLSTGITSSLSPIGKIIIMASMFIGRIGPLTVIVALSQRGGARKAQFPEAQVIIG